MTHYLNTTPYTLDELQALLQFTYLPQIAFEAEADRQDIHQRGMLKKVTPEEAEHGKRFAEQITTGFLPQTRIRWINERVGHGLFADQEIAPGDYVGEYTGIVRKNDRRYFEPLNNYCYTYPVPDAIGRNFVIDATHGNLTRFINHSYTPNLQPLYAFLDGFYHLIFIALRPIPPGEQLCFNYGQNYWNIRSKPEAL